MLGSSPAIVAAKLLLQRFSVADFPVLVEGETGTGKELAARALHDNGQRRDMPFVPVNCGAIPETLIENQFFGHRRGAFTDATREQPGFVRLAERGTLFLDELEALSPKGQVVLLRFLQDHVYRALGDSATIVADVRIIAATNTSLARLVESGEFRSDLYFRLRVLHVVLPPLRDRLDDLDALATHFLTLYAKRLRMSVKRLHPAVAAAMRRYTWPGNVRELENLICRACLIAPGSEIEPDAVPEIFPADAPRADPVCGSLRFAQAKAAALMTFEAQYLSALMNRANGNVTRAAQLAGTERRHLGRLLKKHHIDRHTGTPCVTAGCATPRWVPTDPPRENAVA